MATKATNYNKFDLNALEKYKLREGWLSFLTLFVAFITVINSIVAGGWQNGVHIISTIGLVAFLLGFVLARTRFVPATLAHSFMLSVGMVFIGFQVFPYTDPQYTSWSEKLGSTVLTVVHWIQNAVAGHEHDDGLVLLVSLCLLSWLLGYGSVWLVFRSHRPWWALSMLGLTLFINLSYNPPGSFRYFAVFLLAGLLLVIRMTVFLNEEHWRRNRLFFRPGLWRGAMAVGSVLTLLVTLLAFAAPDSDNANPIKNVIDQLSGPLTGVQGGFNSFFTAPNGDKPHRDPISANNFNSFDSSFTLGGPFVPNPNPVLKVSGSDPTYLQSNVLDQYDGLHWINTYQSAPGVADSVIFPPLALSPNQNLPTSSDKGRKDNQITVTELASTGNDIFVGGDLVNSTLGAILRYHYEQIGIDKVPFDAFQKVNGVLVNTLNSNKPVPPALLPLLTNLYDAYKAAGPGLPPGLQITYQPFGAGWQVLYKVTTASSTVTATATLSSTATPQPGFGDVSANTTQTDFNSDQTAGFNKSDGTYTATSGDWSFTLPAVQQLQALKLKPGASLTIAGGDNSANMSLNAKNNPANVAQQLAGVLAYHSPDGSWTLSYDPMATALTGQAAKTQFETSAAGQTIKSQIDQLEKTNQGMFIDYDVINNRPINLTVHGYTPNYDDLVGANAQQTVPVGASYTTTSLRFSYDQQSLRNASQAYPSWVTERYLQLPNQTPNSQPQEVKAMADVKALAQRITDGYSDPYDKAKAIEAYLRSDQFQYNLNVSTIPAGQDFVYYFLFDSKQGYCTYFSTSMVVMLRSIGIPTREVEGFIGGEPNGDGTYTVRGTEAHAWPQVYFPGYGWVQFEPTPGPGYNTNQLPADNANLTPIPTPTPVVGTNPNDPFPNATSSVGPVGTLAPSKARGRGDNTATSTSSNQGPPPLWVFVFGAVLLLGIGSYWGYKLWVAQQLRLPDTRPSAVYSRLLKAARKAQLAPRGGMTPYEYAAYLAKKLPQAAGVVRTMTDAYVVSCYSKAGEANAVTMAEAEAMAQRAKAEQPGDMYVSTTEIWERLRKQAETFQSAEHVRELWQTYQQELIRYRREKLVDRLVPFFVRNLNWHKLFFTQR